MFAGTMTTGVLGYVYQVLMGRMLTTHEYGLFSALMALFAVCSAPLATLLLVIARRVSEYRARQDPGSIRHFFHRIGLQTTVVAGFAVALCLLLAPQLQAYLKAPGIAAIYLLGPLLFFSVLTVVNDGFLQGLQSFNWLAASSGLRVLLRIAISMPLVSLGYGVSGAVGGTILAATVGWLVTFWPLRAPLAAGRGKSYETAHLSFRSAIPVLIANTAFAAMTQLDMVLVNYYFPPHDAGLYAAASILGKAVMYLPGGIAMALFPMVAENHARDRSSSHLLLQAVGLTTLLCTAGSVFYLVLGEWLIRLLFGDAYEGAGQVLRFFGFAILPMALVMVAEYFLIAKGRVLFAYLFVVIAPLQLLAIHFWHDSLQTVVLIVAASGTVLAAVGYGMLWRAFRAGKPTGSTP